MGIGVNTVNAVSLSPTSASSLIGVTTSFTASGLDSTDTFYVTLGGTEVLSDLEPTSAGVLTFSVSSSVAGTFIVGVYNSTDDLQGSATLVVNDLFAMIMPYIVIFVGLTILFGIIKELKF